MLKLKYLNKDIVLFLDDMGNYDLRKAFKENTWNEIAEAIGDCYKYLGDISSWGNDGYGNNSNSYFFVKFESGYTVKIYNKRKDFAQ